MKSLKRSLAVLCTIFICSACGQAEPPAPAETTSAETVTSAETSTEVTTTAETTTEAQTEETTVSTIVVTTVEVKPETEVTTEATTEATEAATEAKEFLEDLKLDLTVDEDSFEKYPNEAIIISAVLNYYGYSCDVPSVSEYCADTGDCVEMFTKTINDYMSSKGISDIEVEEISKDKVNSEAVVEFLNEGDLFVYWDYDFEIISCVSGYKDYPYPAFHIVAAYSNNASNAGYESFNKEIEKLKFSCFLIHKK